MDDVIRKSVFDAGQSICGRFFIPIALRLNPPCVINGDAQISFMTVIICRMSCEFSSRDRKAVRDARLFHSSELNRTRSAVSAHLNSTPQGHPVSRFQQALRHFPPPRIGPSIRALWQQLIYSIVQWWIASLNLVYKSVLCNPLTLLRTLSSLRIQFLPLRTFYMLVDG